MGKIDVRDGGSVEEGCVSGFRHVDNVFGDGEISRSIFRVYASYRVGCDYPFYAELFECKQIASVIHLVRREVMFWAVSG